MIGGGFFEDDEQPTAAERHRDLLREFGQIGPDTFAACQIAPDDALLVRRHGPERTPSTLVLVAAPGSVFLSPDDARRVAVAMLTAADEADGTEPIRLTVPDDLSGLT